MNKFMSLITILVSVSIMGCAQHKISEQKVDNEIKEVVIAKNDTVDEVAREMIIKSYKIFHKITENMPLICLFAKNV